MTDLHPCLIDAAAACYGACDLQDDPAIDPADTLGVLIAAYTTSNCDDFAWLLSQMTGWPTVKFTWYLPDYGSAHHSVVRAPDGRYLDITGWVTPQSLTETFRPPNADLTPHDIAVEPLIDFDDWEDGIENDRRQLAEVIRNLPHQPFNEDWMRTMTHRPMPGIDVPHPDFL